MGAAVWRVRDSATFAELRRHGRRARTGPLSVTWLPGPSDHPPRLAFAIGRSVGTAVVRNRLRRRLRSLFAEHVFDLRPGTYLISAAPAAATLEYGDLRRTLSAALNDLP
ncbi:MAG: ribonuclease protein component [Acidimicrobiaceae bacterium]|nr:ribonuclease protein component [Acidimicrobiaceae bacterium]